MDTSPQKTKRFVVGVTGASGAIYARRLVGCLVGAGATVHLVVSEYGKRLLAEELGIREVTPHTMLDQAMLDCAEDRLVIHRHRNVGSVLASGSFHTDGMIICPCSSNTLGAIAAGLGGNLIDRAAAVTLKEGRRLVLVPREMPMGLIDLENALRLSRAGAVICPAAPGFYMQPKSIDDLVDFLVGKLLDLVGVAHALNTRWADQQAAARTPDNSEASA